jgi:hypothetical protein
LQAEQSGEPEPMTRVRNHSCLMATRLPPSFSEEVTLNGNCQERGGPQMSDEAKSSMILCSGLEPAERDKIERLDIAISERFANAGFVVRFCQGRNDGEHRVIDFCAPTGTVASVGASEFLAVSDAEAVAMIAAGDAT